PDRLRLRELRAPEALGRAHEPRPRLALLHDVAIEVQERLEVERRLHVGHMTLDRRRAPRPVAAAALGDVLPRVGPVPTVEDGLDLEGVPRVLAEDRPALRSE